MAGSRERLCCDCVSGKCMRYFGDYWSFFFCCDIRKVKRSKMHLRSEVETNK